MISHISLSSADRSLSGDSVSNFTYRLPAPLRDVVAVSVEAVSIPVSWYMIIQGYNDTIDMEAASTVYTATIPVGNYTTSELATAVQTACRSAFSPNNDHTCTFNNTTQKFTIANPTTAHTLNWSTSSAELLLGWTLNTDTSSANTHVAPNLFNLSGSNFIYIMSKELAANTNIYGSNFRSTLMVLNQDQTFGTYISYENQGQYWVHRYSEGKNLYQIDFQLLFSDGQQIDLNGLNWDICLRIERTTKL